MFYLWLKISSNYYDGIWLSTDSDSNNIHDNLIGNNGKYGIYFSSDSNNNIFSKNVVCSNPTDIYDAGDFGSGDDNTCDKTYGWNDDGTTGCTYPCPIGKPDIYFADARESPGSVYHYNTTTGIEETVYTRPGRQLFSFTFHPGIPEKLYYVNAIENKIYRTHQTGFGWAPEEVVYTHTTNVKDIAFAFDKDGKLGLYFSEASKIYKIEDSNASLYYEAELADFADVVGFWNGDFAFDDKNNLYLSSATRVPAGIYKVEGGEIKEIFRDEKEPIKGLVYEDGALYYANYGTKI